MKKVRIFDPNRDESVDHLFRRFMSNLRNQRDLDQTDIQVDLVETDGEYRLRTDFPGVKKDEITVRVDGNIVQIDALAHEATELKNNGVKVLRNERCHGALSRTLTLAKDIDADKVTAKLSDGVLELFLPKKTVMSSELKVIQIS
jgi:HSP20 family protein